MAQHLAQSNNANEADFYFNGFKSLNSTPIPDEFFDVLAVKLSEAELRVLLYIMRRTFGFKKTADAISLSQLTDGIRKRDGAVLDYGTGLSRPSVLKAVSGLQAKGIITVEKRTGYDGRNEVNVYALRFQAETVRNEPNAPTLYTQQYSITEYSVNEQTFFPTPDPQFVSAQPNASVSGAILAEQRRSGDTPSQQITQASNTGHSRGKGKGNYLPSQDNTNNTIGVNPLNQQGKGSLPLPTNRTKQGKAALPGQLTKKDYGSKVQHTEGVNLINLQENSLQKIREQETAQQRLLLANGALALQEFVQESTGAEMVEVEVDGDLLYINFRKLVLALVELGLSEKLASDLAYAYPEAYLWEKITLTRQQVARSSHQRTLRNTAGYLRRAIEEDYQAAATTQPKPATGPSGATTRFPHAQALLNLTPTAFDEINPVYPPEDTAPLPPIYRTDHRLSAAPEEHYNSWSQARLVGSSGGAEEGHAASPTSSQAFYPSPYKPYDEPSDPLRSDFQTPPSKVLSPVQDGASPAVYAELWHTICEDLAGRYRLGAALNLLNGSWLWLSQEGNVAVATIVVASPWQLHELGLATRSAINMALRQQLGPGYTTHFEHF